MNKDGFEIERKFLIAMPAPAFTASCECSAITQTYLLGAPGTTERVRRRVRESSCEYTHTVKRRIRDLRREEDERVIGETEYAELLKRADPARRPIEKTRCCFRHAGKLWELDIFPFWTDRAILEIELDDENEEITLPEPLQLIHEVTDDPRYTNAAMSLRLPDSESEV